MDFTDLYSDSTPCEVNTVQNISSEIFPLLCRWWWCWTPTTRCSMIAWASTLFTRQGQNQTKDFCFDWSNFCVHCTLYKARIEFLFKIWLMIVSSQMNCVNDSHMIVSGLPPAENDQHCVQVDISPCIALCLFLLLVHHFAKDRRL